MTPEGFNGAALGWYGRHGRKDLPWQRGIIPHRVWVSEIMLQQTQVSTVLDYFDRFTAALPDVEALAAAAGDEILHLWTGLGYYSRTRNLHKTAQVVVKRYTEEFPRDVGQLAGPPDIGRSTTGTIASLSMGLRAPILDGNVRRVLARCLARDGYPGEPEAARAPWEIAERFTPHARANHYIQAMVDLGTTLCMHGRPSCLLCPLVSGCRAHLLGHGVDYPRPKSCKALPQKRTLMPILTNRGGAMLLYRRPSSGLWSGLWGLPGLDSLDSLEPLVAHHSPALDEHRGLGSLIHALSHSQLTIEPWLVAVESAPRAVAEGSWLWYNLTISPHLDLAAPIKKLPRHAEQELGRGTAA